MLRESQIASQVCVSPQTCILFALPEERKYFHPLSGQCVSHSGAGARNAARAASELLASRAVPPELLIICGFAGGLSPEVKPGHLILADRVLEFPLSPLPPLSVFPRKPGGSGEDGSAPTSPSMHSGRKPIPPVVHQGTLVTADRVLIRAQEKRELAEQTGAIAVDMETAAAARVAEAQGVPWLAIRVITDGRDDEMPLDFNLLTGADANIDIRRVVWATLTHPWKIPGLIRLGKRSALAGRNLARFLETFLQRLPEDLLSQKEVQK